MSTVPIDLERLIHESLEQLGWQADTNSIAQRVKRLNIGLPLEDEFSIICGWLGQCNIIHKLDQQQYPPPSKEKFQVPDLFANFSIRGGKSCSMLIEVKSCEKNVMSFTPDYYSRLNAYSNLMNLPILIAWKKYGSWVLVSLTEFSKAKKNFNLSFSDAMKNNLLSIVAGDFSFTPQVNSGVHLSFHKQDLIDTTENDGELQEQWKMVVDDVYFTNGDNKIIRGLSKEAQQLFFSWDLKDTQTHNETHIIMHNTVEEQSSLFAHMALTRLLSFRNEDDSIHWRQHLGDYSAISDIENFRKGIEENLRAGIVKYIFDIEPCNKPDFLK